MYDFIYNGKSLLAYGYTIKSIPEREVAERDITFTELVGGDGSELTDNGGYKNVDRKYEINSFPYWLEGQPNDQIVNKIINWLFSNYDDYKILRDSFNPGYFCYAIPKTPNSFLIKAHRLADTTIIFERKPFWYSDIGNKEKVQEFDTAVSSATMKLFNEESIFSAPLIKVDFDSGSGTVTIANSRSERAPMSVVSDSAFNSITIDSASERVYSENSFFDDCASGDYFPVFLPGENELTVSAQGFKITKVTVVPRWRRL